MDCHLPTTTIFTLDSYFKTFARDLKTFQYFKTEKTLTISWFHGIDTYLLILVTFGVRTLLEYLTQDILSQDIRTFFLFIMSSKQDNLKKNNTNNLLRGFKRFLSLSHSRSLICCNIKNRFTQGSSFMTWTETDQFSDLPTPTIRKSEQSIYCLKTIVPANT